MVHERETPNPRHYRFIEHASATRLPKDVLADLIPLPQTVEDYLVVEPSHFAGDLQLERAHDNKSRNEIVRGSRRAIKGVTVLKKALILGSGYCLDIPLEEIVSLYDGVTLVELFAERTINAVETRLTPDEQQKITIVRADITGTSADVLEGLMTAYQETTDVNRFLSRASRVYRDAQSSPKSLDFGSGYHFVSSQLVMSQLNHVPRTYIDRVLTHYGLTYTEMPGEVQNQAYIQEIAFEDAVNAAHISMLRQSVTPDGIVHLADTEGSNTGMIALARTQFTVLEHKAWKKPKHNAIGGKWNVDSLMLRP